MPQERWMTQGDDFGCWNDWMGGQKVTRPCNTPPLQAKQNANLVKPDAPARARTEPDKGGLRLSG